MSEFKWHVYDSGYYVDKDSDAGREIFEDLNKYPYCLHQLNSDKLPRQIEPLLMTERIRQKNENDEEYEEGLPLYASLAYTVTDDPELFEQNLIRFTNYWGMWESDGYPLVERATDIRKQHYEGFEEHEYYSTNSILVLAVEAILLNAMLKLWDFDKKKPKENLTSYFNINIDYIGLPSKNVNEKCKEGCSDFLEQLDILLKNFPSSEKIASQEKVQYRAISKILFDVKNPYIKLCCEIDNNSITTWVGQDNTCFPIDGLKERFFPSLKKRNPSLAPSDIESIVNIIVYHFVQHRLYKYPVRLAVDITSSGNAIPSCFFMPQNLLSAAWLQFTRAILGYKAQWRPVYCSECGEFGFYNSNDWAVSDGYFFHKNVVEGRYCYKNYNARKNYAKKKLE